MGTTYICIISSLQFAMVSTYPWASYSGSLNFVIGGESRLILVSYDFKKKKKIVIATKTAHIMAQFWAPYMHDLVTSSQCLCDIGAINIPLS